MPEIAAGKTTLRRDLALGGAEPVSALAEALRDGAHRVLGDRGDRGHDHDPDTTPAESALNWMFTPSRSWTSTGVTKREGEVSEDDRRHADQHLDDRLDDLAQARRRRTRRGRPRCRARAGRRPGCPIPVISRVPLRRGQIPYCGSLKSGRPLVVGEEAGADVAEERDRLLDEGEDDPDRGQDRDQRRRRRGAPERSPRRGDDGDAEGPEAPRRSASCRRRFHCARAQRAVEVGLGLGGLLGVHRDDQGGLGDRLVVIHDELHEPLDRSSVGLSVSFEGTCRAVAPAARTRPTGSSRRTGLDATVAGVDRDQVERVLFCS